MKPAYALTLSMCLLALAGCTKKSDLSDGMGVNDQPKNKYEQSPSTQPSAPGQPAKATMEDPATAPEEDPQLPGTTKTPAALDVADAGR